MKDLSVTIYEAVADAHEAGKLKGELDRLVRAAYLGAAVALKSVAVLTEHNAVRMNDECKIH